MTTLLEVELIARIEWLEARVASLEARTQFPIHAANAWDGWCDVNGGDGPPVAA